jgi:hypothetical protein
MVIIQNHTAMKAIIKGKRYNTETATHLATYSWGSYNDFDHVEEKLYRTKNGSWFLLGGGGPRSRYSRPVSTGGLTGSANNIVPLSESEAYEWLERHEETELIEQYFSNEIEDA